MAGSGVRDGSVDDQDGFRAGGSASDTAMDDLKPDAQPQGCPRVTIERKYSSGFAGECDIARYSDGGDCLVGSEAFSLDGVGKKELPRG